MKKTLAITFLVDEKEVRRSVAILTGEVLTDEELNTHYFSDPISVDLDDLGEASKQMSMAFVALVADKKNLLPD